MAGGMMCKTCSAWLPGGFDDLADGEGLCQAHPPVPIFGANVGKPGSGIPAPVALWPTTHESNWCREWQAIVSGDSP
jgi:hypothetical protein